MNTTNGSFIEKSIPNNKQATVTININGVESTMLVSDFFDQNTNIITPNLYQLPVPNIAIENNQNFYPGYLEVYDPATNDIDNNYQMQFENDKFVILNPVNDLTQEQVDHGVYIEMMYYRGNNFRGLWRNTPPDGTHTKKNKWVVSCDSQYDAELDTYNNLFAKDIKAQFNCGNLNSRFGTTWIDGWQDVIRINRPNQIKITNKNISYDIHTTLNGFYSYFNCEYQSGISGATDTINALYPWVTHKGKGGWGGYSYQTGGAHPKFPRPYPLNNVKTYNSNYKNLYIKYRYVMFNPLLNNGKGDFVTGPTSNTICVTPKNWAFAYAPQTPSNLNAKITSINGLYNDLTFNIYKMVWSKTLQ